MLLQWKESIAEAKDALLLGFEPACSMERIALAASSACYNITNAEVTPGHQAGAVS